MKKFCIDIGTHKHDSSFEKVKSIQNENTEGISRTLPKERSSFIFDWERKANLRDRQPLGKQSREKVAIRFSSQVTDK